MPWIFNLPGGVVRQYPSQQEDPENGLSFQEAEARVRREINPRLVNTEDPSSDPGFRDRSPWAQDSLRNAAEARQFFRDMGDQFSGGIADIGTAVGQIVNIFDPTASSARERGDVPIGDRMANASREWGQEQMASLSPEMLHDQNDPDWLSPGNVAATMGRSAPSLIPTLVGGALSGGSITVPAIIEGAMGGGSVADTIDESIRDVAAFDPEMFINSPLGQQALAETDGDYPRAVELAANRAKGAAPVLAGAITARLSRLGEDIFRAGQGPARRTVASVVARIALGGFKEGLEETSQSTQEQVAGNLAIGQIDGRSMWEGADQAAIMGGIAGAGMGSTMGGVDVALSNMRRRGGGSGTGPAQVQGPVMPPPGHPNRGPATGNGNPPGWTAPNVDNAEDADYTEPGENIIEDQRPRQKPKGWRRGTESWADLPPENSAGSGPDDQAAPRQDQAGASDETSAREAELRAQDAANSGDPEDTLDSDFDEEYASSLQQRFEELGRARKTKPDEDLDTSNAASVSVVPLFKYNREDIETSDEDALAVYRGAQMEERPISDTATFQAYSALDNDTFASEDGDPADAVGFGLKIVDADGNVSYHDIGAQTAEEAARYATPQQAPTEGPNDNSTLAEELNTNNDNVSEPSNVEIEEPQSRDVVATGRVQNLKPAANEALNSYRTKGEQGLQEYLGGLNVTATRSLLRNLGGQGVRSDSMPATQAKIVAAVKRIAKMAETRGMPAPSNVPVQEQEAVETPPATTGATEREQETAPTVAPKATLTVKEALAGSTGTKRSVMGETDAFAAKRPSRNTPERIKEDDTPQRMSEERTQTSDKPQEEAPASDGAKRHRSPAQIKAALREVSSLEDDAYDAAVAKLKITPEEAAAVREAMKTDNGLDNLRPVFNDALRAGKNTKKSKQTEEAPKAEPKKKAAPKEEKESPARVRKERDAGDRAMAESLSRGQPKDYDVVRRSVEQWLEVERDRIGARSDASWYKQWPIARQEALIQRTWNAVNGHGGAMASRGPDAGSGGAGQALEGEVILPNRAVAPSQQGGSVPSVVGALEPMIPAMRAAQADIRRVLGDEEYFAPRQPIDVDALEPNRRAVARAAVALEEFVAQNRALRAEQAARALPDGNVGREELLARVGQPRAPNAPNADKMASRDYGKGKVSGDLNPLQMFSRAERMARTFPEESSTRMHMLKWLEKRVRKAELKFIDMSEFLHGGPTGNALRDKATRQELVDYITSRKLRLTVRYAYGQPGGTIDYSKRFNQDGGYEREPMDKAAEFAGFTQKTDEEGSASLGQYSEYTLLGGDVIKHNYLEVGIVIEPGQPGSEFTGSHVGGKGAVAGMLVSDYPIEVNGEKLNAFAVHQGQSDYHDAKPEQYADDLGTPYRDTHPELMFRTAFMMAVSSDHDAIVWPTADTIRMYEGHSTYKGSFYDERWPAYARSWLSEYKPVITTQKVELPNRGYDYDTEYPLGSFEDELSNGMSDESHDIKSDIFTEFSVIDQDWQDFLGDYLSEMQADLAARQEYLVSNVNLGQNPNVFEGEVWRIADAGTREFSEYLKTENIGLKPEGLTRIGKRFAQEYAKRFPIVMDQAKAATAPGVKPGAEVYVMKITPAMKEAFRETGIPMFSQGNAGEKPIQADDNPIPNKAWVNEMERAIKAAAACAAGQAAAGAAFGALAVGMALGAAGAVPIANLIAAEGDSLRWMTDFRQRQQQEKIDAGLAPANDYVDENGNYRPPQTDEEGYVLPPIPVAGGGRPLRPARPYTQAELAAAEREIRSLAPRATITPENVSRQADIRRYGLRNGSGAPDDAPPRE